jgi:antitoxin ParD1/3/4
LEAETVPKNTSIALSEHFADFVEEQVAAGRYGNASEVIRAGLRLLEEREAKLRSLREAIDEGLKSGPAEKFNVEEFIAAKAREPKRG